jgi:hypothetical protein
MLCATALCRARTTYTLGPDSQPRAGVPNGTVTRLKLEPGKFYPGTPHNYAIYVPAQYDAYQPTPFMVFLDGLGGFTLETAVSHSFNAQLSRLQAIGKALVVTRMVNCSSWKSNCLGRLAGEIAFNRRFSVQRSRGLRQPDRQTPPVGSFAFAGKDLNWLYAAEGGKLFRRAVKVKGAASWALVKLPRSPL